MILGVFIMLIFAGVYLTQIATYATTNRRIVALIEDRDRLERRNEELRAEIARLQTVPRLLERAQALGFRPATADDIEYIVYRIVFGAYFGRAYFQFDYPSNPSKSKKSYFHEHQAEKSPYGCYHQDNSVCTKQPFFPLN